MEGTPSNFHFRFDQYEVNLAAAELRRNGRRVPIQDKPLRLLVFLSQRSGEVVSRSEIQEHLWPPDTTVVFEDGLNTAVKKLREALNEDSDKPRYIETVRRRGYRFLGKVHTMEPPVAPDPAQIAEPVLAAAVDIEPPPAEDAAPQAFAPIPPALAVSPPRRRLAAVWMVAAAIVCIASAGWLVRRSRAAAVAHAIGPHTIAVLPVANLTGDERLSYLCEGATVEIIARLGDEDPSSVHVIARTSAMSFRDSALTARQIGEALGADYLLESTLQGDRTQIRLIVQLIRASDQTQIWSRSYIGEPGQLQAFENDIADRGTQSLTGTRALRSAPQQTVVTAAAHDLYLKGLSQVGQRSREGFEGAMLSFGGAVQKEPRYAEAYAELAVTYNLMGQYAWMRQDEARSQGRAAALQALALDPTLAEARAALGFSYWFYDWDNHRARQELLDAVAREPNNVDAHHWLAMVFLTSNQLPQAEQQMRDSIALDPASPILKTNLGWVHYTQGRFPLAVEEMSAVVKQNPDFLSAHYKLIPAAFLMGDRHRAWQESQALFRMDAGPETLERMNQNREGSPAAWKRLVETPSDSSYANQVEEARYLVFAGDTAGAIAMLQDGLRRHNGWMIFVPSDPAFAPLHSEAAFQQIARAIEHSSSGVAAER